MLGKRLGCWISLIVRLRKPVDVVESLNTQKVADE
jgi:hypothetical protein